MSTETETVNANPAESSNPVENANPVDPNTATIAVNNKNVAFAMVALGAIFFDENGVLGAGNVRGDWEYETDPNPKYKSATGDGKAGLYEDIERNGLSTPLWVVKLEEHERVELHAKEGVWYDYLCLRGHRRGRVLKSLAAKYKDRFKTIPCQVYPSLTKEERIDLMVDQVHVKGLSDWGIYLAIKALAFARMTEPDIASKIGKSRGFVQAKLRVARLPQVVETEYLKKCKGQPAVNLTDKNLNALMMAQNADEGKGLRNVDGSGTPSFKAEWATLADTGKPANASPTAMTRKELLIVVGMSKDSIIADTLRYAAGDPVQLEKIANQLETLRAQAAAYVSISANDPASSPPAESVSAESVNPAESVSVEDINANGANIRSDDNPAEFVSAESDNPAEASAESDNPVEVNSAESIPFESEPAESVNPVATDPSAFDDLTVNPAESVSAESVNPAESVSVESATPVHVSRGKGKRKGK